SGTELRDGHCNQHGLLISVAESRTFRLRPTRSGGSDRGRRPRATPSARPRSTRAMTVHRASWTGCGPIPLSNFYASPIHLTRLRAPADARQVARTRRGLLPAELVDLDLEVLRHQLPHGDAFVEQPAGHHALAQIRRKRARPRDHALGVVARHL